MKPIEVKYNTYIDYITEVNDKDPKFKVGDHAKISKYKIIFAKEYTSNWSEEVFVSKEVKNNVPWTYVINDPNGEKTIGTIVFKEKNYKKQINKNLGQKKSYKKSYKSNGKDMIIYLIDGLVKKT